MLAECNILYSKRKDIPAVIKNSSTNAQPISLFCISVEVKVDESWVLGIHVRCSVKQERVSAGSLRFLLKKRKAFNAWLVG